MKNNNELKYYKYQIKTINMNYIALIIIIIEFFIVSKTYRGDIDTIGGIELLLMLLWFILHEFLHYIGFLVNKGVTIKSLVLGIYFEKGILYCMCRKLVDKKSILIALNFPLFFIGILTLVLGYIFKNYTLVFLSIVNIAGAVGDVLMTIQISKFPKDIKYIDVDDATGYYIISKSDISNVKVPQIKLIESGLYDPDKFKSEDQRSIVITKTSRIILIIFIILSIILIYVT